jgi:hypothetical protein
VPQAPPTPNGQDGAAAQHQAEPEHAEGAERAPGRARTPELAVDDGSALAEPSPGA